MLEAKIIRVAKKSTFISSIFAIPKANNKAREIIDYSHLTPHFKKPDMFLPSIFQVVESKEWADDLHYVKVNFRHAFHYINVKESSKYVTTFKYSGKYYEFNYLPFGISIAPFECQRFVNAITRTIKRMTPYTWGHIDDILIAHNSKTVLKTIVKVN